MSYLPKYTFKANAESDARKNYYGIQVYFIIINSHRVSSNKFQYDLCVFNRILLKEITGHSSRLIISVCRQNGTINFICGHNGTVDITGRTSRSKVSACGQNGTIEILCGHNGTMDKLECTSRSKVSACGHNGTITILCGHNGTADTTGCNNCLH